MVSFTVATATLSILATACSANGLKWAATKNLFVFGDSYTTTGWNISLGVSLPAPGYTSSNGLNWVQFLTQTYNITDTSVYNLAYGGATIDSHLVTPYLPTVESIVDQVALFDKYLAQKPAAAPWKSSDSLFAFWIGINDVGNSWYWTNVTQSAFHDTLMNRLFGQIDSLYASGARSFLFLTTPPLERTPLFISQGSAAVAQVKSATNDYNAHLARRVANFTSFYNQSSVVRKHGALGQVTLFDTGKVFNTLLNNADALGFVNVTGYSELYENGTPSETTQIAPYKPVSSFFWLNSLHPLFTVHNILAKAIATAIS